MFSSLAEVIEVAIRAEYQVGIKGGNRLELKRFQCCLNVDTQDAKPPPLGRLNDREQAK